MSLVLVFLATVAFRDSLNDEIIVDPGVTVATTPAPVDHDGVDILTLLAELGVFEFSQRYERFEGADLSDVKKIIELTPESDAVLFSLKVDVDPFGDFLLLFTYDPQQESRIVVVNNEYLLVSEMREYQYQVFPGQFQTRIGEYVSKVDTDGARVITAPIAAGLPTRDCNNLLDDENRLRALLPYHPFPPATAYESNGPFFASLNCAEMALTEMLNYKLANNEFVFSVGNETIFIDGEVFGDDAQAQMEKINYLLTALRGVFYGRLIF